MAIRNLTVTLEEIVSVCYGMVRVSVIPLWIGNALTSCFI